LDKWITEIDHKKEDKRHQMSSYLNNQVFRKTYISVKKHLDDWLRHVKALDVSVAELKKYKEIKTFTRSYLRELKYPKTKQSLDIEKTDAKMKV
jgi:hypothetical protein